jgi:hypothetical protein
MPHRLPLPIVLALVLVSLSGCASPGVLRQEDAAACRSYGFQQGTSHFSACLQRESLARRYSGYGPGWSDWY